MSKKHKKIYIEDSLVFVLTIIGCISISAFASFLGIPKGSVSSGIGLKCLQSCFKNGKYLASIIDNSVITCDEIIDAEEKEIIPTNVDKKKQPVEHKISIFYLQFY